MIREKQIVVEIYHTLKPGPFYQAHIQGEIEYAVRGESIEAALGTLILTYISRFEKSPIKVIDKTGEVGERFWRKPESETISIQLMQLVCALNGAVLTPMPGRDQDGLYQIDQIVSEIPQASVVSLLSLGLIEQLDPKKWTYCLSSKGREAVEEYC